MQYDDTRLGTRSAAVLWLATLLLPLAIMALVAMLHLTQQVPLPLMVRDVLALGRLPPLAGAVSSLGVLLWCATAAICLFVALAHRHALARAVSRFLLCAGLLSAWLTIDDGFQLHEDLAPRLLGLRERYVYLLLGAVVGAFLYVFRAVIRRTPWPMLALALGCLGISALLDTVLLRVLQQSIGEWQFFWEDGAKLLGIACWFSYFTQSCARAADIAVQPQLAALVRPAVGRGVAAKGL